MNVVRRMQRNIKALRQQRAWSLQHAADHIGITKPHLWELESGRSQNPTLATLERFADAYDVNLQTLLFDDLR